MQSLDSAHDHVEEERNSGERDEGESPRRLTRRAGGSGPGMPAGGGVPGSSLASSLFGAAVNSGIHSLQYRGGRDLAGAQAHEIAAQGFASGGGALPHMDAIQRSFGKHDIGGIRAHVGGAAAQASSALGAEGYAAGDAVAFANAPDLHLAAHEAAHVVQQRGGVRLSDGVGSTGDEYERHADEVADLVVRGQSAEAALDRYAHRGAAGGPAVQRYNGRHGHGHGHGGGGHAQAPQQSSAPPPRPAGDRRAAAHIVREANPSAILEQLRTSMNAVARSYDADFPSAAYNALARQLQTMLAQHQAGVLAEQTAVVSAGMYDYRFRLWGSISHGAPMDVRQQTGHGTLGTGTQEQSGYGDSTQDTEGVQDTVGAEAGGSHTPGDSGGRGGTGQVSGEHQTSRSHQTGTTGSDSHQSTSSTSMDGRLEHIEYVSQVTVELHGQCDVVRGAMSSIGHFFGTQATDGTSFGAGPQVIGEVPLSQQGAAHGGR